MTIEAIRAEARRERRGKEWCHCGASLHVHDTMVLNGCRLCALDVRASTYIRGQRRWKTLALVGRTMRDLMHYTQSSKLVMALSAEWRCIWVVSEEDAYGFDPEPDAVVVVGHANFDVATWVEGMEGEPATWLPDSAMSETRFVPADDVASWLERAHYYREPTREEINRSRAHRLRVRASERGEVSFAGGFNARHSWQQP